MEYQAYRAENILIPIYDTDPKALGYGIGLGFAASVLYFRGEVNRLNGLLERMVTKQG
jgi:hypothetical protein